MVLLTVIIVIIVANLLPMEQSKMFILIILAILTFLTGMFFVYDIQMIVGGKRYQYSIDDYVLASMNLYLDFA